MSLEVLLYAILDVVGDCHIVSSFANRFFGQLYIITKINGSKVRFFCKTTVTLKPYVSLCCRSKMPNISSHFCSTVSFISKSLSFFKLISS